MRRDTPAVSLAGLLFFLSGAAALVYQVAWQRLLALHLFQIEMRLAIHFRCACGGLNCH